MFKKVFKRTKSKLYDKSLINALIETNTFVINMEVNLAQLSFAIQPVVHRWLQY